MTLQQDSPPTQMQLWSDESRGGVKAEIQAEAAHPKAELWLSIPEKIEGSTFPSATFEINFVLKIGGASKHGLPEVAFALTKASLQCGELV